MRLSKGIIGGAIIGAACAVTFAAVVFVMTARMPQQEMGFGPSDAPMFALWTLVLYGPPALALGAAIGGTWAWHRRRSARRRGLCPTCRYDLRGAATQASACPECGGATK